MTLRQQVLYLWLAEGALDTPTVAWAFHDGCDGRGPALPGDEPPYRTGADALVDGWCLLQSPAPQPLAAGDEHAVRQPRPQTAVGGDDQDGPAGGEPPGELDDRAVAEHGGSREIGGFLTYENAHWRVPPLKKLERAV